MRGAWEDPQISRCFPVSPCTCTQILAIQEYLHCSVMSSQTAQAAFMASNTCSYRETALPPQVTPAWSPKLGPMMTKFRCFRQVSNSSVQSQVSPPSSCQCMRSASSPNPRARSCPKPRQTTTPMARHTTTTDPDLSDDNDVPTTNEQSNIKGRIDTPGYVSADHYCLPRAQGPRTAS
jgi:hypothetical protein